MKLTERQRNSVRMRERQLGLQGQREREREVGSSRHFKGFKIHMMFYGLTCLMVNLWPPLRKPVTLNVATSEDPFVTVQTLQ